MPSIIRKSYQSDCLLVAHAVANNESEKNRPQAAKRLREETQSSICCKMLCNADTFRITQAALSCGLYFRPSKPLAIISGAGIAGLAASFELRARGFKVVIVEKRGEFSRYNVVNLNIETQVFLKKFNLIEKFEKSVAARITEHKYVVIDKNNIAKPLELCDVSQLRLDESLSFEPANFSRLFKDDGIYSVRIDELQKFLAENALEVGVNIFGNATAKILSRTKSDRVSKVKILSRTEIGEVSEEEMTFDQTLEPDLFFIAEGAHSTTARELGMSTREVTNVCTDENWIFGNMSYSGEETFVVSLIDASQKTLRIANVIFNAMSQVINIAVTSEREVPEEMIREQIRQTAHQAFTQRAFPLEEMQSELLRTVSKPVSVTNRTSSPFSKGNVYLIGDSAGSSSPLAGLGAVMGLSLAPKTVEQLLDDYESRSSDIDRNFHEFSEGYTSRWIEKSERIKQLCLNIFNKEESSN